MVSRMTVPLVGAVQVHQAERPPGLPAWLGSPACFVAPRFVPKTVLLRPVKIAALAKLSLVGAANIVSKAFELVTAPKALVTNTP